MANLTSSTSSVPTSNMGDTVYDFRNMAKNRRSAFERRWYDNNFFDDGYHYRFYSRVANKIIDLADRATLYNPMRAIPKASRQVRGIANLLVAPDFVPVIYPEKTDNQDPQSLKEAEDRAHKASTWMQKEWDTQDLVEKLAFMAILAAKHGVSWMQIWPDSEEEAIKTQVYDAFDIFVLGEMTEVSDLPFIIKSVPRLISQIKADSNYDEDQVNKITPDNKFASSDIKEAYMQARFNRIGNPDEVATLIENEALIKERLNSENMANIRKQDDGEKILKGRKEGDSVIRQVFTAGNVWLRDRYVDMPDYNFVDFRMEPGPIYGVPLIERFIPQNKSLDLLVSRAERYSHSMVTGIWMKQQGQQFKITNDAGGQIIEYSGSPPVQAQIAPIPAFFFELMNLMGSLIEEQGTSTSTLGKLPTGVKANSAIESLKESEYANLVIPTRRLKNTVKRIAEKMLDIADQHYITPQTVYDMKDGKASYFDVIGGSALEGRKKLKVADGLEQAIPLKKDYKVEIEVQTGMAYTQEGKKAAAKDLAEFLLQLAQAQMINPDVVKQFVQQLFKIYNFGPTEDIMTAMNQPDMTNQLSEQQLLQMKMAVLEAMQDAGEIGPEAQKSRMMENKIGVLEALKESGLADNMVKPNAPQGKQVSETLSYKDAPEDIKRQIEMQAGLQPSQGISPAGSDQIQQHHEMSLNAQDSANKTQQTQVQSHVALNPPAPKNTAKPTAKKK